MEPRDLVCARCWQDFFDTEAFEQCCTSDSAAVEAISTVGDIRNAALSGCAWCSYINSFLRSSEQGETKVTIVLSPSSFNSCTPKGRNTFYLDISCWGMTGQWTSGPSLFLHAFTTAEDKASGYVTARPVRTDVGSETATCQIATWLRECEEHMCCPSPLTAPLLPTRIIEVNPPGQAEPRLLESGGAHGVYATLSYCWGAGAFQTLNQSNYAQFTESLDLSTLPLTIRDAITTTRKMSIPYIWIDAFCIVQDSEDDKMREISQMKDIYASSAVTIVAASAKSVDEGFLYDRDHSEVVYTIPVRIQPGIFGTMSVNELNATTYDERSEPLEKRAWAMQEQILAQRTITFATHTMVWNCKGCTGNFGDSLYCPHDLDSGYNDNDEKYTLNLCSLLISEQQADTQKDMALSCWLRLVTAYSLRSASVECDKLNAIAGIASYPSFVSSLGPGYYSGMWEYKLIRQLTWYTSDWHRTLSEDERFRFYRPTTYRAPSWSWASVEGGIVHFDFSFDDEDESEPEIVCEVIECLTRAKFPDPNPFGEVISGYLRLRGSVRDAWLNPQTYNVLLHDLASHGHSGLDGVVISYEEAWTKHIEKFKAEHPDIDLKEDTDAVYGTDHNNMKGTCDESGTTEPMLVSCVPVTSQYESISGVSGMLLTSCCCEGKRLYKRIGYFTKGQVDDFDSVLRKEIDII